MVVVFLLLTYMAMQVISAGLLNRFQSDEIASERQTLQTELGLILEGLDNSAHLQAQLQAQAQSYLVNLVYFNRHGLPQWTSGLGGTADLPPQAVSTVLSGAASAECPRPQPRALVLWCVGPVTVNGSVVGALAASQGLSGIYQVIQDARGALFSWTLAALVVIGGFSLLVARSITGPIGALTRRARAMAAGDFAARLPVGSRDEVGQLAQMFNHLARRLQETEAVRKEIVANVSHELRTPITTIKLYTESLLDWGLDEPEVARPKLEVIAAETDRMVGLIGDLLDLSRIDHRGVIRSRRRVDVGELALSVATSQQARAQRKGVALSVEDTGGCAAPVDADRIVQVLSNLLTNAIDFTPDGGRIAIRVCRQDQDVCVEVTDTGPGIPVEALPRIFDRFYRVDPSRSREHGGSGLGLAIAKEIVEAHGGTIEAVSPPTGGTRIRFTLPGVGTPE